MIKEETHLNEVTEQTDSEKEKQIDDDKEKLKESPLIKEEIVLDKHNKETDKDNIIQDNDKINSLEDTKKTEEVPIKEDTPIDRRNKNGYE